MKTIKQKYPLITLAFILTSLLGLWLSAKYLMLTINVTASLPYGLYIKANADTSDSSNLNSINRGNIVLICLDDPYKKHGLERGYLIKGSKCNGADPLMKIVIAVPDDNVTLHRDYIVVNGAKYLYATASRDSYSNFLISYPRKNYRNTTGYWLIGTHHKNSWDSRYFGPVQRPQIIAKLKPLMIIQPRH